MIEYLKQFPVNGTIAICLYWLPLVFCAACYLIRTFANFRKDRALREGATASVDGSAYYSPTDTIGTLIGRGLVSIIPVANLFAAVFDLGPKLFGRAFRWLGKTFDQPLVPDSERAKELRRALASNSPRNARN